MIFNVGMQKPKSRVHYAETKLVDGKVTTLCGAQLKNAVYLRESGSHYSCPKCFAKKAGLTQKEAQAAVHTQKESDRIALEPVRAYWRERTAPIRDYNLAKSGKALLKQAQAALDLVRPGGTVATFGFVNPKPKKTKVIHWQPIPPNKISACGYFTDSLTPVRVNVTCKFCLRELAKNKSY